MCLSAYSLLQPEFNRVCATTSNTCACACACVCECANCEGEGGEEEKKKRGTQGVAEVGEKGTTG